MAQNPLYNLLGGNMPQGGLNGLLGRLEAFKRQFNGDPREQIQKMLNSGQITQAQYDNAVKMANQIMQTLKR